MRSKFLMFVCLVAMPSGALAQSAPASSSNVTYPGSVWSANGTLTPAEPGNILSLSHAEQGVMYRGWAELFALTTLGIDSAGHDWNNKSTVGAGVRFTQTLGRGMVRVSVARVRETRWQSETVTTGTVVSVDAYHAWGRK
jgi:hypothetical protein